MKNQKGYTLVGLVVALASILCLGVVVVGSIIGLIYYLTR
jgi:type II secretory pathway pseudopilin PulG